MVALWRDEDLQFQGVERQGMCLVSTKPANAGTVPASSESGRLVTYATASRAVPTIWQRVRSFLGDAWGALWRFVGYGGAGVSVLYVIWLGLRTLAQCFGAR